MKVSTEPAHMTVVRRFKISEGHPVVGMAYSRDGKKIRVYAGEIDYTWKDGRWIITSEYSIKLNSVVLRKDGTDSKNLHSRPPGSTRARYDQPWELHEDFAWLQPIIDLLRPGGDLTMTILNEHEVNE
jgi:hypothetical protein